MRSLILGLCVVSNTVFANFNAGEMMSSMMPLATTMLQNQQQAKQAEAQTDQARAQLVGQENAMVQQQAQLQQAETNNLMSQENKGYPILDPFARQSYWALRDTQFKQSMAIAAQRSQLETKASKDAIDKEFQATQQMMTAVGGLMKTAGAQVQKIGEASAKQKAANDPAVTCSSASSCVRSAAPSNGANKCPTGFNFNEARNLCLQTITGEAAAAAHAAQQRPQTQTGTIAGCQPVVGNSSAFRCGGQEYPNEAAARAASENNSKYQETIQTRIYDLTARAQSLEDAGDTVRAERLRTHAAELQASIGDDKFLTRQPNLALSNEYMTYRPPSSPSTSRCLLSVAQIRTLCDSAGSANADLPVGCSCP